MKSPLKLEGMLKVHINNQKSVYPELIEKISNDMYINDLVLGRNVLNDIEEIKQSSIELFAKISCINSIKIHHYRKKQTAITITKLLMPNSYF